MLTDSRLREAESERDESLAELADLAALWFERHVRRQDNRQVSIALRQVDRESRRLERKARPR